MISRIVLIMTYFCLLFQFVSLTLDAQLNIKSAHCDVYVGQSYIPNILSSPVEMYTLVKSRSSVEDCTLACLTIDRCRTATFNSHDHTCFIYSVQLSFPSRSLLASTEMTTISMSSKDQLSNLTLTLVIPNIVSLNNTMETSDVQFGDLNNDGHLDLIATYNNEMLLAIWLGRGNGTFSFLSTYRTGSNPLSLTTTYLNDDELLDIVVSNADDNTIWFYQNVGGGIMLPLSFNLSTGTNTKPRQVVAADVNDDGILDYVTANYHGGGISVILGGPNLTFTLIQSVGTNDFNPVWLIVTYFNNDAYVDLGVANGGGLGATGFAFMAGFGNGSFARPVFYNTSGATGGITAGDFNSDGNVDVALTNKGVNSIAILFGNGLGVFSNLTLYQSVYAPISIVACDGNRDGFLDLYVTARGGNAVHLFIGRPDGRFTLLFKNTNTGALTRSIAVGDLNGDGILDVAIGNDNSNIIRILLAYRS